MIIIGLRFFTWGSDRTPNPMQCGQCGWAGAFIVKNLVECPNCKTRYNAE